MQGARANTNGEEGDTSNETSPGSPPSVQGLSEINEELGVMPQEQVRFLKASMQSFDDFPDRHERWIRDPNTTFDLLTLLREDSAFLEENRNWIWPPNASTEAELLKACNNTSNPDKYTNNKSFGTRVNPGHVLFARNRNKQKVYGQGMHLFLNWTRREGKPVDLYAETLIQRDIITIVNLQPDQIAIAMHTNQPVVLLPGRHAYHDPDFILKPEDIITVQNETDICLHTISIVRVGDNQCGLAYDGGSPVLLKPGLHMTRSPSFELVRLVDTGVFGNSPAQQQTPPVPVEEEKASSSVRKKKKQDSNNKAREKHHSRSKPNEKKCPGVIVHDNITIVQVPQTLYGCALLAGEPVFLLPGLHIYNNASFSFKCTLTQSQPHVQFENLHIIQVQPDQFGLAFEGAKPYLLPPGVWTKTSPLFRFEGFRKASETKIEHGSITRFVVENGQIGFAWKDGNVCEIMPGIGVVNNPNFKFIETRRLSDEVIQFGNVAHVTTLEGQKRPVFVNGKLVILSSGYKKFFEPNLTVGQAFPTGEIIKPITTLEVLTRDRTPMLVTGQVTYQINNASDLILNLGYAKLEKYIEQSLMAILRHAFSITDLSTISPDPDRGGEGENVGEGCAGAGAREEQKEPITMFKRENEELEGQNFRSELVTEIHNELSRNTKSWGITVHEVAISDVQFKDQEVADKLAAATSNTRTAEAEFDLTLAQSRIKLEKAKVDATEKMLIQKNETQIERIDVEARSHLRLIEERAEAEAEMLRKENTAKAEAMVIKQIAEAKKDAAIMEAEGLKALAKAQIAKYSDASCLKLRMMELWVQGAEALARAPTPAVLLQNNGEGASEGGLLEIFRKQGKHLLGAAGTMASMQAKDEEEVVQVVEAAEANAASKEREDRESVHGEEKIAEQGA